MVAMDSIRARIKARHYLLSKHATDQLIVRDISVAEVEQALLGEAELILGILIPVGRCMCSAPTPIR